MISPRCDCRRFLCILLLAAGWLLVSGGCGSDGREALEGSVTLDGQPLESGYIQFRPVETAGSPAAGADVTGGRFAIARKQGVLPGKFRVEITASRKTGRKTTDQLTGEPVDALEQCIPARYNSQSELTADVKAGGPNQVDFQITLK